MTDRPAPTIRVNAFREFRLVRHQVRGRVSILLETWVRSAGIPWARHGVTSLTIEQAGELRDQLGAVMSGDRSGSSTRARGE